MRIVRRPIGGSKLVRDYLEGVPAAAAFYAGSPFSVESYRRKARELDAAASGRAEAAAAMIRPVGPPGAVLLREVVAGGGYFVTTGQQPGLFGGPLYSLYKALSAVRLATRLGRALGKPVMPLFWVASEDHDWEEANHTWVLDGANALHRLDLGPEPGVARRALADTPMGAAVPDAVARLTDLFPDNDFRARYVALLRETCRPDATLAHAFAALMGELLADTPLGLVDAADPTVKAASRPLLHAEADESVASEDALVRTGAELRDAGYQLQVPLIPAAVNLFLHGDDGRDRLQRNGTGDFRLRRSGRPLSRRRVLEAIAADPCAVSPNVLLRPVVESALFPTLAYVGGPGELAYFGQLGRLFRRHGLGMPVAVPRASLLVVERKVAKALDSFDLEVDDVQELDGLLGRLAQEGTPDDVKRAMGRWRSEVAAAAKAAAAAAVGLDPTLKGAVAAARNSGLGALATLEKKIARAVKQKNETAWNRLLKAQANLWPRGKPQERILGPLQYVMRYGPAFTAQALEEVRPLLSTEPGDLASAGPER